MKYVVARTLSAAIVLAAPSTFATNIVAVPAGYVRLDIPANSSTLSSTPFLPFDDSIQAVFHQ